MAKRTSSFRRLISLVIMLVLVLVMMQKVTEPGLIANFFRVLGVPLEATSAGDDRGAVVDVEGSRLNNFDPSRFAIASGHAAAQPDLATSALPSNTTVSEHSSLDSIDHWQLTMRQVFQEIVDGLGEADIQQLASAFFQNEVIEPRVIDAIASVWATIKVRADTQFESAKDPNKSSSSLANKALGHDKGRIDMDPWRDSFRRFESNWSGFLEQLNAGPVATGGSDQRQMAEVFEQALDAGLIRRLTDGAPWRKSEFITFVRQLQGRNGDMAPTPEAPIVTGRELDDSTTTLRGRFVNLRGRIHRIDQERLAGNNSAQDYYVLWLQSEDNHPQPIAAYTTNVSSNILNAVERGERPQVELYAIVSKRIPYGATSGLEIAPTLFAGRVSAITPVTVVDSNDTKPKLSRNDAALACAMALMLAAAIVIPLMWSRRRFNRRRIASIALVLLAASQGGLTSAQQLVPPWAKGSVQQQIDDVAKEEIRSQMAQALEKRQLETGDLAMGNDNAIDSSVLRLFQLLGRVEENGWIEPLVAGGIEHDGIRIERHSSIGKVVGVDVVPLSSEQKSWYQPDGFVFRIELNEDTAGQGGDSEKSNSYRAVTWSVPSLWLTSKELSQPIEWDSLIWVDQASGRKLFDVVTAIRWKLPPAITQADLRPTLPRNLYRVGEAGWDLANYDHARRENKRGLSRSEARGLYSLLQVAPRLLPLLSDEVVGPVDFIASSNRTVELCKLIRWNCRVVQGRIVDVSSSALAGQSGITNGYIELDGFVQIGNARFEHPVSPTSDDTVDFVEEYPVTILVSAEALQHSDGLPSGIVPTSARDWLNGKSVLTGQEMTWEVGEYVDVSGVAYRMWSYDSEYLQAELAERYSGANSMTSRGPTRQLAPLVIAADLKLTAAPIRSGVDSPASWLSYVLCLGILLVLSSIVVYASHDLRRRGRTRTLAKKDP